MENFVCKICGGDIAASPDNIILCNHHESIVHLGCCTCNCSMDGQPCMHSEGKYKKE